MGTLGKDSEKAENYEKDRRIDSEKEKKYEENRLRMYGAEKNMLVSRIYNVYGNLALMFLSLAMLYIWLSYTNAGIKLATILDEEIETVSFPWFGATLLIAPVLFVINFIGDIFLVRKLSRISQAIYIVLGVLTVLEIFFKFEPMRLTHIFILLVYSVLGFWTEDFAIRAYNEIDILKNEEGYPRFSYLTERGRYSKYVKYRERWLKKQKQNDYYGKKESPIQNFTVSEPKSKNEMDGISVDAKACSEWFDEKKELSPVELSSVENESHSDMELLETDQSELDDSSEYIIDDVRHKPL